MSNVPDTSAAYAVRSVCFRLARSYSLLADLKVHFGEVIRLPETLEMCSYREISETTSRPACTTCMHSGEILSRKEGERRIAHTQRCVKVISNPGTQAKPSSDRLRQASRSTLWITGCIFTCSTGIALLQALKACWIHFLSFIHLYNFVQEQSFTTAGLAPSMLLSTIVELLCRS